MPVLFFVQLVRLDTLLSLQIELWSSCFRIAIYCAPQAVTTIIKRKSAACKLPFRRSHSVFWGGQIKEELDSMPFIAKGSADLRKQPIAIDVVMAGCVAD
eukprot:4128268-Amphidinium_carterae.1